MCATLQAQSRVTLPTGVTGVSFGTAQRYTDASGKEMCAIVPSLADPPVFPRGVTEISYGVQLQPRTVKVASARIVAPSGQGELHGVMCHAFSLITGGFSQTQLGSTISRVDKAPLKSGAYTLRVTVDGQTADVRFKIE
jgi:hypothetical protein